MLYFAYGSNMSSKRLSARIGDIEVIGVGRLLHHQLHFHKSSHDGSGKCDVVATENQCVFGVVYSIDPAKRPQLDQFEGLGNGYVSKHLPVFDEANRRLETFLYQATHTDPALKPYRWYKQHVLAGAIEHALPEHYQSWLRSIECREDPDQQRHQRELAIYPAN